MISECPTLFDSHLHIIDPRFPLVANNGYLPAAFTASDYRQRISSYRVSGGCIVSGSFQQFDQDYLLAALAELGPNYVGVTQLPATASDEDILALNAAGVRGVRFNLHRGGSEAVDKLAAFACRLYEIAGWHVELYVDARALDTLMPVLTQLPRLAIDHLGLSRQGQPNLLRLVEGGAQVKATGFGRLDFAPMEAISAIIRANPQALMFGTDLPGTRAPRPFSDADIRLLLDNLDSADTERVLSSNARHFYRLDKR